jgi:hypothetical protein
MQALDFDVPSCKLKGRLVLDDGVGSRGIGTCVSLDARSMGMMFELSM